MENQLKNENHQETTILELENATPKKQRCHSLYGTPYSYLKVSI